MPFLSTRVSHELEHKRRVFFFFFFFYKGRNTNSVVTNWTIWGQQKWVGTSVANLAKFQTFSRTTLGTKISLNTKPACCMWLRSAIIVLSLQSGFANPLKSRTNFLQLLSTKTCWKPRVLARWLSCQRVGCGCGRS